MKFNIIVGLLLLSNWAAAQSLQGTYRNNLSKLVTFTSKQTTVREALQEISSAGNFFFSYNGRLINQDSIINLNVTRMPVRDVLDKMFDHRVAYKESDEYIMLRYAVNHFTIEPENITTAENLYLISGYIVDTRTGKRVKEASVYEKRLLQATLTDENGFFTLRFKGNHSEVVLTASKETYRDTALVFLSDIKIEPKGYDDPDKEKGTAFSNAIDNLGISKFLLTSKQRIQSLNIPDFLANTPFQASLLPGLSSHGMMSSRVVNKVSLNVLGGYTAGVDGVEVGGLFNLTSGKVKSFQAAGLLNAVGGTVEGTQFAGILNYNQQSVRGFQAAGISNVLNANLDGVHVAGVSNIVRSAVKGMQIAGVSNFANKAVKGIQLAGVANIAAGRMHGTQIAGVVNYAKKHQGLQIGLVNLADTTTGVAIGLLNLSKNGYKQLNVFANELINTNLALKTGNANLYTLLLVGRNHVPDEKIETFGLGLGHDFVFGKSFALSPELIAQHLHLGNWDHFNLLTRFQVQANIRLFKRLAIFGGPAYAYYRSDASARVRVSGYKQEVVPQKHRTHRGGDTSWLGWNVGVSLF